MGFRITLLSTGFILLFPILLQAQVNPKLRKATEIHWCGLDFSMAKFIGTDYWENPTKTVEENIKKGWNDIIFKETRKFNLNELHKRKETIVYRGATDERNEKVNPIGLVTDADYVLSHVEAESVLQDYPSLGQNSVGLIFLVESFDAVKKKSSVWVIFFDFQTHEPIITEKYFGKPGGKGELNYWANSIEAIAKKTVSKFYYYE